jgi:hypothetical protein
LYRYTTERYSELAVGLNDTEVGGLYKVNPVVTHSLKAPGSNP